MLINVQIDDALHQEVKALSAATGVSISFKVRQALERWVSRATEQINDEGRPKETTNDRHNRD